MNTPQTPARGPGTEVPVGGLRGARLAVYTAGAVSIGVVLTAVALAQYQQTLETRLREEREQTNTRLDAHAQIQSGLTKEISSLTAQMAEHARDIALLKARSAAPSGLSRSPAGPCDSGYVAIPAAKGSDAFFCAARFEMKAQGGKLVSTAAGDPIHDVTHQQAVDRCAAISPDHHLMTNLEYEAARSAIETVGDNWTGGAPWAGAQVNGSWDRGAADESNPCTTPGGQNRFPRCTDRAVETDFLRRRTHQLPSGEVIWDLGGNYFEWMAYGPGPVARGGAGNVRNEPKRGGCEGLGCVVSPGEVPADTLGIAFRCVHNMPR